VPPNLKPGMTQRAFDGPPDGRTTVNFTLPISQKRLTELVEDWEQMYNALLPFAKLAETLQAGQEGQLDRQDLFRAKGVLDHVAVRLARACVAQAERSLAGRGDVCRLCGSPIYGSDDFELAGYCSLTCLREDGHSDWPSSWEVAPAKKL
jgi:hypothetical protein